MARMGLRAMRDQGGASRSFLEERNKLEGILVSCEFKLSNSQRSDLWSALLNGEGNMGGSGGRLKNATIVQLYQTQPERGLRTIVIDCLSREEGLR